MNISHDMRRFWPAIMLYEAALHADRHLAIAASQQITSDYISQPIAMIIAEPLRSEPHSAITELPRQLHTD